VSNVANCYDGITTNTVWITNVVAQATGNGTMTIQFTIEGGYPGRLGSQRRCGDLKSWKRSGKNQGFLCA